MTPETVQVDKALWERGEALLKELASGCVSYEAVAEARAVLAALREKEAG